MNPIENHFRILVVDDNAAIHDDFKKILVIEDKSLTKDMKHLKQTLFGHKHEEKIYLTYTIDSAYSGSEATRLVAKAIEEKKPYALAFVVHPVL